MTHEDLHQGPIIADLSSEDIDQIRVLANGVQLISGSFAPGNAGLDEANIHERKELRDRIVEDLYLGQIRERLNAVGLGEGIDVALSDSLREGAVVLGNGLMQDLPVVLVAREGFRVSTETIKQKPGEIGQGMRFTIERQAPSTPHA